MQNACFFPIIPSQLSRAAIPSVDGGFPTPPLRNYIEKDFTGPTVSHIGHGTKMDKILPNLTSDPKNLQRLSGTLPKQDN